MKRLLVILALLGLLVAAGTVRAENAPDPRLASVAEEVAGHAVSVWCETNQASWAQLVATYGTKDPYTVLGFSLPSPYDAIYLSPQVCIGLRAALHAGPPDTLPLPLVPVPPAEALFALLHESSHQLGILDEDAADCHALGQLRHYLTSLLHVPAKVTVTKRVKRWHYVRVNGKRVGRAYYVRVRRTVPNPRLARMVQAVSLEHTYCAAGTVTS